MADSGKIENVEYLAGYGSTHTASLCSCTQLSMCTKNVYHMLHLLIGNR